MVCGKPQLLLSLSAFFIMGASHFALAETVQGAARLALDGHPSIAAARAGYHAAEEETDIARSGYFPEVSLSATGGRVYQDNATSRGLTTTRGAAYSGYGQGTASVRQMLFDGNETSNLVDSAKDHEKSLSSGVMDTEQQIVLRAAQAYLNILRTQEALNLLQEQKTRIADYETRIKGMVDEGAADEAEFQQAHDVSMIIDGSIADYEGQALNAQAAYAEATGQAAEGDFDKPVSLAASMLSDVEEALSLAQAEHPMLKSARFAADSARDDISAARAAYYPDVSGELSYDKIDKKDVIGGEAEDGRAVLRANWNFSTGGRAFSGVDEKKFRLEEAQARLEETQRTVEKDIRQAYANHETYQRKLALSDDRIVLNEKLFAAYGSQFEAAKISLLSLMRAESQLFGARLERINNEYNLLSAEYDVLASTGRLKDALFSGETQTASAVASGQ